MDPELKELLEVNLKISTANNRMLKKIRRIQKQNRFLKILYWLVIIGITLGAFYFLQPLFEQVKDLYGQILPTVKGIGEIGSSLPRL